MSARNDAYKDYLKGKKNKEIADKYNVSESTVRTWISRYWKQKNVATSATKSKSVATKKGGQKGNENAVGHGAPLENKNARTHGAYERIMLSMLDEDEKEIFNESLRDDAIEKLREEYALLCAREVRITKRINNIKAQSKGEIILDSVTVTQTIKRTGEFTKGDGGKLVKKDNTGFFDGELEESTETNTTSNLDALNKLESVLNQIHNQKVRLLMNIEKIENERVKLDILKKQSGYGENSGNEDNIKKFVEALQPSEEYISGLYDEDESEE